MLNKRLTLAWLLAIWAALGAAQVSEDGSDEIFDPITVSIELPKEWLILQHGEVVTFVANPVLEGMGRDIYLPPAEYHDLFTWIGEACTSNWYALNGQVLDVGDGQVVYQAPSANDETFDVLVWHNRDSGQYAAVGILLVCEGDAVAVSPEKIETVTTPVFRVPTASNSGVQLFAVQQGGNGYSICLPGRPLNPRPSNCQGGSFRTSRDKLFDRCDRWRVVGEIVIDARVVAIVRRVLGIDLLRIGFRLGQRVKVEHRECIRTHLRIQDCYECRNGTPVYVGSRVIVWRKRWTEVNPTWARLFFPPPAHVHSRTCASSGNCPCP